MPSTRRWTLDDVNRIRKLLSEHDWNPDVALPIYFNEVPQTEEEKLDAFKTAGVILRGREFDKRMESWK
jgi:hypothetical protein